MTTPSTPSDERLQLVYQEAVRGLTHQQGVVESMNTRAGSLIFATSFASSLLGSIALADGIAGWDWLAIALLLVIGGLMAFLLWPYHNAIHRGLAMRIKHDMASNWRVIQRLRIALQFSLVLLIFEILAWLLAIAQSHHLRG